VEAGAGGEEACGEDAGVVEDEEIAGVQEGWEVREEIVVEGAGCAVEDEHTASAAEVWWSLRDEVFGEVEVEVSDAHTV